MTTASGTIYRFGGDERIQKASVKATKGAETKYQITDDDGDFSFDDLDPGKWTFVALHEKSFPSEPKELDMLDDTADIRIDLFRLQGTEDKARGDRFFTALLITLGALVVVYFALHLLFPSEAPIGVWDEDPWRLLEVLMWGLAGILVNKILITGWYLRSQRFYREGIVMHVAHLVATPLLVLVTVLLLSLVTFQITLANSNELTLDLSDPAILIAFSFLIGTVPWPLWNFIEDTGKRFAGRLS